MITTCERSGLQFDTDSKRVKNHPRVTQFVNDANKDGRHYVGAYAKASELVAQAKGKFDSIDDLMSAVTEAYTAWKNGDAKAIVKVTDGMRIRAMKDASNKRERVNAILKQYGYRWSKEDVGSEDSWAGRGSLGAGIGEVAGHEWVLNAPDGREVSIAQAFREIGQVVPE